jgi:cytochrome c oxidase subunit 3
VSETILDHGYVPEEHAPDPVVSHGDPTQPGKIGIWLFLASEIMFFIGILGTYIILRSGSPRLFAEHASVLSKIAAGANTLVLIFSSLTMALAVDAAQKGDRRRVILFLALTLACAAGFMGIKYYEYTDKLGRPFTHYEGHQTLISTDAATKKAYVYDGHVHGHGADEVEVTGYRMELGADQSLDIHTISEEAIEKMSAGAAGEHSAGHKAEPETWTLPRKSVGTAITYGPWKNVFFACYFALTGIHGLHVVGGMVAIGLLLAQSLRGRIFPNQTEYTGLYWHFVDLVWIFLFPLLYLI